MKVIDPALVFSSFRSFRSRLAGIVFAVSVIAVLSTRILGQATGETNLTNRLNNHAQRIALLVHGARAVVLDEPVNSLIVMNPELVKAEANPANLVTFTGLAQGETIVIVSGPTGRRTFAIEVRGRPEDTPEEIAARTLRTRREEHGASGSYTVFFTPIFTGGPRVLRQDFDYRRRLSPGRSLRIEGNTFKLFGRGDRGLNFAAEQGFGLDRLSFGLDTRETKLDLLDSELIVSPLSLNGYTMRGLHLVSAPESRLRGLEVFAGLARPYFDLFKNSSGYLGGFILPVTQGKSWRLRAGALAIASKSDSASRNNGYVWQADSCFEPNEQTTVEGELAYARGELSWRARLSLRRRPFTISGETLRLDRRSPLVDIGAQSSGRKLDAFSIGWKPNDRFNAFVGYHHAAVMLPRSRGARLNNSTLFASGNYNITPVSHLGFRFSEQKIESAVSDSSALMHLRTRNAAIAHRVQFAKFWTNDLEVGLTSSHEQKAGARLETAMTLREELRRSWDRWSATAYLHYSGNTPSLANLLFQNPQILPPGLRESFLSDPARFIVVNRAALPGLLAAVALPTTRSADVGLRFQGMASRYTVSGDVRYSAGEILALPQRGLLATFGAGIRLDAANSVQVSGARSFMSGAARTPSSMTFSYTHRFGAGSGGGFQYPRLLGLDRGKILGRAFFDLNSNGKDDPGEPGISSMRIRLDEKRFVITDEQGRFSFSSIDSGEHKISLVSEDLGVRLRASTPTEQQLFLGARQTIKVAFGLTNFGFISGRIFNDLFLTGEQGPRNAPGVGAVQVKLHPTGDGASGPTLTQTVDASGIYSFRDLPQGTYMIEIDPMTLPADFRMPAQTSWVVKVVPLKGTYLDIPISAQRAIAGVVFRDQDNDGQFDPEKDEVIDGARVMAGRVEALSDRNGSYMLRNLPAGKIEIHARLRSGNESNIVTITLAAEPNIRRAVNLAIANTETAARQ